MKEHWTIEYREAPSFGDGVAIQVRTCQDERQCEIRIQPGHFMEFVPWRECQRGAVAQLNVQFLTDLVQQLLGASVQAAPPQVWGAIDGTTFTLELFAGMGHVSYTWYAALPAGWVSLESVVKKLSLTAAEYALHA